MTISKNLKTLKQAEKIQNKLYDEYDSVELVLSPSFSEDGVYAWEVKSKEKPLRCPDCGTRHGYLLTGVCENAFHVRD